MGNRFSKSNQALGTMSFFTDAFSLIAKFFHSIPELIFPSLTAQSSSDDNVDAAPNLVAQSQSYPIADGDAMDDEGATLGATAAAPASPQPQNRRQPTPAEAQRYEEVARQLNEVARQIETEYSNELDDLVDSLNLVAEVAYDAFAGL